MEKFPRVLVALAPALALSCAGCTTCAPHSTFIGLDHVFYVIRGEGEPTVVLEADIGDGYRSWSSVLERIASISTTFAYSRPGYTADSYHHHRTDGRRTAGEIVALLRDILRDVGLKPPYVLVGHSAGGTYMLHYAARHPEEVAGIVLIDAPLPGFREECLAEDLDCCRPCRRWAGRAPNHVREELRGLPDSETEAPSAAELGDIPVTVIAAGKPPPGASAQRQQLWLDVQRRFASGAANGRFVAAEGCGHWIHQDDPGLVIREIDALLERAKARGDVTDPTA